MNLKDVSDATADDDEISLVVQRSINGWIRADKHNPIHSVYNRLADKLSVADCVLFRGDQAVVPTAYANTFFSLHTKATPVS